MAHKAEDFARRAIRLALDSGSKALHAQVQSTLGELLLAQARPHEAVTTLEEVALSENQPHHSTKLLKAEIGTHWIFNEVRWDLAQAYLCENANDLHSQLSEKERHDFRKNAADLLQEIRNNEIGREDQPFTRDSRALDPANPPTVCLWSADTTVEQMPDSDEPHYKLAKNSPGYASRVPCNWLGIIADAKNEKGEPVDGMALHVWGGGVDTTIWAGKLRQEQGKKPDPLETHDDVLLSYNPMDTHDFYFAQLEDGDHKAVSPAYPVRTYANVGAQCGRNLISLTFIPSQ